MIISKNDLHIVYCLYRDFPGKSSTAHYNYARFLVKNGIRVTVVAGNDQNIEIHQGSELISGINIYRINTKLDNAFSIHPMTFSIRAYRLISKLCDGERHSIIHQLSFPNLGFMIYPSPIFRLPQKKVLDIRGTAIRNEIFDHVSCNIIRFQSKLFKNVLVISEEVAKRLKIKAYKILPVGVDFSLFIHNESKRKELRTIYGLQNNDLLFVYVGHINTSRRLDILIKSFIKARDYAESKLKTNIFLMIVGDGSDRMRLQNYVNLLSFPNSFIFFIGSKPYDEIPFYLSASDVALSYITSTSQYLYQPPIKTYEYLANGLCTIATKTVGNLEIISHCENGFIVDDTEESLISGITSIIANPKLRMKLSYNARRSIVDYDYENIVRKTLIPYYEEVLKKK